MVLEVFSLPSDGTMSGNRYDDIPAFFDFSSNISYPPTHDSNPVDLIDPVIVRPYKGYSVGYDRFGRKDFEFKFSDLPKKDFSRWGMTIEYDEKEGNILLISRFDTTIKFFVNETAYVKLEPHSRYGIAMDASNVVGVLAWLPERAFRKVKSNGLVVYQLTQPGSQYVLRQQKILLPGRVIKDNDFFSGYKITPRKDLEENELYSADDRFFAAFPKTWNELTAAMVQGSVSPQPVVFSSL